MSVRLQSDAEIAGSITCILSDVDGVMTDGRIIYDSSGNEVKRFHVRDGLAIKLWMKSGFHFGVVTARQSQMVQRRCEELGILHISQGDAKKWQKSTEMLRKMDTKPENVCFIGDDLPDLSVMRNVGLAVAPSDAALDVRHSANWVLRQRGGNGAVRELIERLLRAKNRWEEHLVD